MNTLITILTVFLFSITFKSIHAQDTLIVNNNYKYKFGVKLISEQSSDYGVSKRTFQTYSGGLQVIRKIKNTKSSFESGVYLNNKAKEYVVNVTLQTLVPPSNYCMFFPVYYHYLSIPFNYRLDTKSIYFSGGIFADYLLYRTTDYDYLIDEVQNYNTDRKINIGFNFSLGLEKSVSPRTTIITEARLAFNISNPKNQGNLLINSGNLAPSFTNYGFSLGLNYKLLRKI